MNALTHTDPLSMYLPINIKPIPLELPVYIDPYLLTHAILKLNTSIEETPLQGLGHFLDTCTQYSLLVRSVNVLTKVTKAELGLSNTEHMYFKDIDSVKNYLVVVKNLVRSFAYISPTPSDFIIEKLLRKVSSHSYILELKKECRTEFDQELYSKALEYMLEALLLEESN